MPQPRLHPRPRQWLLGTLAGLCLLPCGAWGQLPTQGVSGAVRAGDLPAAMLALQHLSRDRPEWEQTRQELMREPSTLGLWILADMSRQDRNVPQAARWTYTALLSTRLDAAMCRHPRVEQIEYHFLQLFSTTVLEARVDMNTVNDALKWVREHHVPWVRLGPGSTWVCEQINRIDPRETDRSFNWGLTDESRRAPRREAALKKFLDDVFPHR